MLNRIAKAIGGRWYVAILWLFLASGCANVLITGRNQMAFLPDGQLTTMGEESYQKLLKESTLSSDTTKIAALKQVGQRIADTAEKFMRESDMEQDIKNFHWEFNLIQDDKTINAFCMPGGKVAFYTGILPLTQDETGIAVVMGHEVAHAIAKHGNERMSQMMLAQLGGLALATALQEKPEQTQQIFLQAYGLGAQIGLLLPYSRQHEYEADRIGLVLMARAGYDPRATIPFWQRMNKQGGSRPPEFLSTHPAPENRIHDIENSIPEAMSYYHPSP